jgi:hypothetical protein
MQRFPSVPFVDLDLLLDDGLEDPTLHLTSQGQVGSLFDKLYSLGLLRLEIGQSPTASAIGWMNDIRHAKRKTEMYRLFRCVSQFKASSQVTFDSCRAILHAITSAQRRS